MELQQKIINKLNFKIKKQLIKLQLKDFSEMTDSEMKFVVGGSGSGGSIFPWDCEDDEEYSVYYLRCMKKQEGSGVKVGACEGMKEGDRCAFDYNGRTSYGKCRAYAPDFTLHCSDSI